MTSSVILAEPLRCPYRAGAEHVAATLCATQTGKKIRCGTLGESKQRVYETDDAGDMRLACISSRPLSIGPRTLPKHVSGTACIVGRSYSKAPCIPVQACAQAIFAASLMRSAFRWENVFFKFTVRSLS